MAGRSNMLARTPGGEGELIRAHQMLGRATWYVGRRIRLNPGGGEYEAEVVSVERQPLLEGWVRIAHIRPGFDRATVNVVPPSTEVRILE